MIEINKRFPPQIMSQGRKEWREHYNDTLEAAVRDTL